MYFNAGTDFYILALMVTNRVLEKKNSKGKDKMKGKKR